MGKYLTEERAATYDADGAVDYLDVLENAIDAFDKFKIAAGARLAENLVDLTARAGYALIGHKPKTPQEMASEYFVFDFTDGQAPEQSSFLASAWVRLRLLVIGCRRFISGTVARERTSHIAQIRVASPRKTCSRLISAGSSISFRQKQKSSSSRHRSFSEPLSCRSSIPTRRSRSHSRMGQN